MMQRASQAGAASGRWCIGAAAALPWALLAAAAAPAQTRTDAGTRITNVAGLAFDEAGQPRRVRSNVVTLTVIEVLDVAITAEAASIAAPTDAGDAAAAFTVANTGNAAERFTIDAGIDRAGATIAGIAADADDDGRYDPAVDQAIAETGLSLASGESRRLFVLVRGAGARAAATTVTATATAAKGHGTPGRVYPGAGIDGGDAVVGRSGASAAASTQIGAGTAAPSLVKSQLVMAPDGSERVQPGSTVTYRMEARFPAATAAVAVVDRIPAGTRFVPGSITVDGRAATDAADADAATFADDAVQVVLGDITAASTRSIQFDVQIQ